MEMALLVAQELRLAPELLADVETAALLHDMGKIGISDAILRKPGALTDEEWAEMRRHPEIGERIVAGMEGLAHLAEVVRAEHERWDGLATPTAWPARTSRSSRASSSSATPFTR